MRTLDHINNLMQTEVYKNTIQEYLIALLTFLILLVVFSIIKRFFLHYLAKVAAKTPMDVDDFVVRLLSKIGWPVFIVISMHLSLSSLDVSESIRSIVRYVMVFVVTIRVILLLQEVIEYSFNKFLQKRMGADSSSAQQMMKSMSWVIKWAMWVLGGVFILDNLGVNISSLVAGIGIGGIAVAMASQAVLGDAFSAMSIYLDKPFEIGDFIIIDDKMGTVEHIGVKTTRIRSLSGEQLVFSNSDLTKSRIQNYKRMQTRRVVFKVGILYQTPIEKVEKVPSIIKEILAAQDVNIERVHFMSFGDFSLVYEIAYHVKSSDYNVYMDKQQAINLGIMRAFRQENIKFVYPTQSLYVRSDAQAENP